MPPAPQSDLRERFLLAFAALAIVSCHTALMPRSARAHGRSLSYSSWEIDGTGANVQVRMRVLEWSRLGPDALPPGIVARTGAAPGIGVGDPPASRLPQDLILLADGRPCAASATAGRRPDDPGWIRYAWRIECPEDARVLSIRSRLLLEVAPSHMHFARVRFADDPDHVREQVLTEASPEFILRRPGPQADQEPSGSRLRDYVRLGIEHILTGWDHLAFVFGLLLLAGRIGEVARLVTGFTLAHSLTLALAVQGLIHPHAAAVESVIAFSVALVAIEKGWWESGHDRRIPIFVLAGLGLMTFASLSGFSVLSVVTIAGLALFTVCYFSLAAREPQEWLRICLTFAFGLVHGLGFAGVLVEMDLPAGRLVPALLGFNLGVEIGQIGVVLLLWPLLVLGARLASAPLRALATQLSAAALCGLGIYWFVERAFPA